MDDIKSLLQRKALLERKVQLENQISQSADNQEPQNPILNAGFEGAKTALRSMIPGGEMATDAMNFSSPNLVQGNQGAQNLGNLAGSKLPQTPNLKTPIGDLNPRSVTSGLVGGALRPSSLVGLGATPELMAEKGLASGMGDVFNTIKSDVANVPKSIAKNTFNSIKKSPSFFKGMGENVKNVINPEDFAGQVRNDMFQKRTTLGQAIDPAIEKLSNENPTKTIDLSDHFNQMKGALLNPENPGLASDIKSTLRNIKDPKTASLLNDLISNPDNAKNLTLQQSEEIKRAISQSPVIASKMKMGRFANWTSGDHEVLDLLGNIKNTQAESFPELSGIRKPYADFMKNYNQVKGKFKPGQLIKNMKTKFGDPEINTMAKNVLPENSVNQITGFRRTGKVLGAGAKAAGVGAAVEFLPEILRKLAGK